MEDGLKELPTEQAPVEQTSEEAVRETEAGGERAYTGWLRLAYTLEFLLALNVVYTLWNEIGGQGHLDLLPWYTKLMCGVGLAWSVTRFTAGIVELEKFWNWRTRRWFFIILFFIVMMGGIVYYYHLHEIPAESDSEDASATSVELSHGGSISQRI